MNGGNSMIIGGRKRPVLDKNTGDFAYLFGVEGGKGRIPLTKLIVLSRFAGNWKKIINKIYRKLIIRIL